MKQVFYGKLGGLYFCYRRSFGRIDKDFFLNTLGSYNLVIHRKLRAL